LKPKWVWAVLAVILMLAAYLRLDFLMSVSHFIPHDTFHYDEMVRQWLGTGVYAYKDTVSNAQVTPGYPLIMAAVYQMVDYTAHDPYPYLRYLNLVISMANLVLLFFLARRWAGDAAALLAAFFAAIYPSFIWTNGAVLTEVPAAFMLTAYLYVQLLAFESRKLTHALYAGAILGLTALIRPEFMPLCIPMYFVYSIQTRDRTFWKPMLAALAGLCIIMSPWWVRNIVVMDRLILTGTQTNPFYAGTFPYKNWEDGLVDNTGKTQKQIAIERIKAGFSEHTWLFVKWYTIGKLEYTYGKLFYGAGHQPMYRVLPQQNLFHAGIVLSALLGMILSIRRWRDPLFLLGVVIVVMSCVRLLFIPEYRYNFTVMPLIILFSAFAAVRIISRIGIRMAPPLKSTKGAG
jgi:4-amino-4-deoxy-L-arabinose transferase-like glycosyltransferase